MSTLFCADCGQSVATNARFCDSCGHTLNPPGRDVGQDDAPPSADTNSNTGLRLPVTEARSAISNWVMPFNATLVFGALVVSALDFLSPRIALLPIAATVAVVGLIGCALLRHFVAPSLPAASKLRAALAPESRIQRSPLMIATAVLSALMVSGAAWSAAEAGRGGILAGKFDAARHAQIQLGVLQSVQKEQRVQTAVMEDIREGRASNPRRELANQGILWTDSAFSSAVENRDIAVVSLFLAGGMRWRVSHAKTALSAQSDEALLVLLDHPALLEKNDGCREAYRAAVGDKLTLLRKTLTRETQTVPRISALHLRMVKMVCTQASDFVDLKASTQDEELYQYQLAAARKTYNALGPAPGTVRTAEQCRSDLSAGNGQAIRNALPGYVITQGRMSSGAPFTYDLNAGEILLNRAKSTGNFTLDARGTAEISAYCALDGAQKTHIDDFNGQMLKQVRDALG